MKRLMYVVMIVLMLALFSAAPVAAQDEIVLETSNGIDWDHPVVFVTVIGLLLLLNGVVATLATVTVLLYKSIPAWAQPAFNQATDYLDQFITTLLSQSETTIDDEQYLKLKAAMLLAFKAELERMADEANPPTPGAQGDTPNV